ncbi:MAG TPA: winged helix family transcriptional regulator, partial [Anaerolineae bacterium]|nr:winged helix family transcriptional regulator [Anaerolineae bacterium]
SAAPAALRAGELTLDSSRRELRIGQDKTVYLTPLENRLLHYLMSNSSHILTTEALISQVWGAEGGDRDMLRQLVRRLRRKIEPDPSQPIYIETVPGHGYGLIAPVET